MRLRFFRANPFGVLLFGGGKKSMFSIFTRGGGREGGGGEGRKKNTGDSFPRRLFELKGSSVLAISRGDLTQWEGDAIVNAANERMLGGGGVDGAIHRAAGPQLREECFRVKEVAPHVRCPEGEARITRAFRLNAEAVIHTVGPIYRRHEESSPILSDAYKNSMLLCKKRELKSIAFPAISCGIYGYPQDEAAKIAIETVLEFCEGIDLVEFVLFGKDTYDPFVAEASSALKCAAEDRDDGSEEGQRGQAKAPGSGEGAADIEHSSDSQGDAKSPTSAGEQIVSDGEEGENSTVKVATGESMPAQSRAAGGKADAMDIANVRSKHDEGVDGVAERETKIHKGEQSVSETQERAIPSATSKSESSENVLGGAVASTSSRSEDHSAGVDMRVTAEDNASTTETLEGGETFHAAALARTRSVETESQEPAITTGHGSNEDRGDQPQTSLEEDTNDSQETTVFIDSQEDSLTFEEDPGEERLESDNGTLREQPTPKVG